MGNLAPVVPIVTVPVTTSTVPLKTPDEVKTYNLDRETIDETSLENLKFEPQNWRDSNYSDDRYDDCIRSSVISYKKMAYRINFDSHINFATYFRFVFRLQKSEFKPKSESRFLINIKSLGQKCIDTIMQIDKYLHAKIDSTPGYLKKQYYNYNRYCISDVKGINYSEMSDDYLEIIYLERMVKVYLNDENGKCFSSKIDNIVDYLEENNIIHIVCDFFVGLTKKSNGKYKAKLVLRCKHLLIMHDDLS